MKEILQKALKKRKGSQKGSGNDTMLPLIQHIDPVHFSLKEQTVLTQSAVLNQVNIVLIIPHPCLPL